LNLDLYLDSPASPAVKKNKMNFFFGGGGGGALVKAQDFKDWAKIEGMIQTKFNLTKEGMDQIRKIKVVGPPYE